MEGFLRSPRDAVGVDTFICMLLSDGALLSKVAVSSQSSSPLFDGSEGPPRGDMTLLLPIDSR